MENASASFKSNASRLISRLTWLRAFTVVLTTSLLGVGLKAFAQATEVGSTQVLKWKDGKQAVYFLAFDDGCPTHLVNVIPELTKRGIVGNFYINPGKGVFIGKQAQWEKLISNPSVVFCNHTLTHVGAVDAAQLDDELAKCNEVLRGFKADSKWPRLIAFGKPGGVPWKVTPEEVTAALAKHHLVDRPPFAGPPMNYKSAEALAATVDETLKKGEIGHADFHGVGGDWLVTPTEWFLALLDKLEQEKDRIWVADTVSAHQYQKERETAQVQVLKSDASGIQIKLTSAMDLALYDYPLTLETQVPASWKEVTVTQAGNAVKASVTGGVVRYEAVPGAGDVTLTAGE